MSKLNKFQERTLEAAIGYATDRGWHVLPVSKNKKPLVKDWTRTASKDEEQIVKWWLEYPSANIGILTGPESGFWVVDTDNRDKFNGLENLAKYFGNSFTFDAQKYLVGKTPTGGIHLLFQWDDNYSVKTTSDVLQGVDFRGIGGQIIVAPSSRNIDGEWLEYRWNDMNLPISPMQPWTYDLIKLAGDRNEHKVDLKDIATGLPKGRRDEMLNKFAFWLKGHDVPFEMAVGYVLAAAKLSEPPFDGNIARDKVIRAYTMETLETEKPRSDFQSELEKRFNK